jgi:hypothetical protein
MGRGAIRRMRREEPDCGGSERRTERWNWYADGYSDQRPYVLLSVPRGAACLPYAAGRNGRNSKPPPDQARRGHRQCGSPGGTRALDALRALTPGAPSLVEFWHRAT